MPSLPTEAWIHVYISCAVVCVWRDQFQNKFQNQIYRQERAEVCNDNTLAEHGVERGKPSGGLCATNS